jgi:hypothetical protein
MAYFDVRLEFAIREQPAFDRNPVYLPIGFPEV